MEASEGDLVNYVPPARRHLVYRTRVSTRTFWFYSGPAPRPEELGTLPLLCCRGYIHLNDVFFAVSPSISADPDKVDYVWVVFSYLFFWLFWLVLCGELKIIGDGIVDPLLTYLHTGIIKETFGTYLLTAVIVPAVMLLPVCAFFYLGIYSKIYLFFLRDTVLIFCRRNGIVYCIKQKSFTGCRWEDAKIIIERIKSPGAYGASSSETIRVSIDVNIRKKKKFYKNYTSFEIFARSPRYDLALGLAVSNFISHYMAYGTKYLPQQPNADEWGPLSILRPMEFSSPFALRGTALYPPARMLPRRRYRNIFTKLLDFSWRLLVFPIYPLSFARIQKDPADIPDQVLKECGISREMIAPL